MRLLSILSITTGCSSWTPVDADKDGFALDDCWFSEEAPIPPEGAIDWGISSADIHAGAFDLPYDGIDANCDGSDDFDLDGDGYVPEPFVGLRTLGVDAVHLVGVDCWDLPIGPLEDLAGAEIHSAATDTFYDGIDANCDGADDFDADGDGVRSDAVANPAAITWQLSLDVETLKEELSDLSTHEEKEARLNAFFGQVRTDNLETGQDCWDDPSTTPEDMQPLNDFSPLSAAEVYPGVEDDRRYDGIDQDCGGSEFEFDADGDGYDSGLYLRPDGSTGSDCNDENADLKPDETGLIEEIYYNGVDDNCNAIDADGDKDGDGYWRSDYMETLASEGVSVDVSVVLPEDSKISDCDDDNPRIFPQSPEICDGITNDCDSTDLPEEEKDADGDGYVSCAIDASGWSGDPLVVGGDDCDDDNSSAYPSVAYREVDPLLCMQDADGDGYGNDAPSNPNVDAGSDCDDGDSLINPDWDGDSDGFHVCIDCDDNSGVTYPGAAYLESSVDCMEDGDGDGYGAANASIAVQGTDCDDADMAIHPAASEVCDGLDNNCNNQIDDEDGTLDTSTQSTFYLDGDIDGYGDINSPVDACDLPSGYIDNAEDCDDANNAIFPGATEGVGDEIDQDCDGEEICYENADGDAFRTATEIPSSNLSCGDPGEALASMSSGDCDDASATTYPGAAGNESAPSLCRRDDDGDGYGDSAVLGSVTSGTDCDDSNSALHPGVDEVCDGIDNDCDALIDDADDSIDPSLLSTFYRDGDSDGYGDPGQVGDYCAQPGGSVSNGDDCDDSDATLTPEDNDFDGYSTCDGDCDDSDATRHPDTIWYSDGDGDGYGDPSTAQTQCQPPATDDIQTGGDCDDADASLNLDDEDGDGYSTCDGDCDDFDDTRSLDDLDSDGVSTCDGDCDDSDPTVDALDADSDGFSACVDDCDDADPNVNPDAAEDCGDGIIDNDCSDFAVCLETDLLHVEVEGDASNGDSKLTHYIASGTFGTQQYIGFGNREAVRNGTSLVGSAYLFQRSTIASGSGTLSLSDRILELQIHDTGGARRFGDSILFGHDINQDSNSLPDLAVSQRMNAGRGIYFYWSDTPLTSPVSYSANTTTESGYDAYLSIASSLGSKSTGSQWGTTVRMSNLIASTTEEDLVFGVYTAESGRGLVYVAYDGLETLSGNHEITAREDHSSAFKYFSFRGESSAQFGFAIDVADLNGDGQDDLIASSHKKGRGYVSLVLGPLSASNSDITNVDFRIKSTRNSDRFGYGLMAGDLEEDGDVELAVHASNNSSRTERVYVYDLHSIALDAGESGFGSYFSTSGEVNATNYAAMIIEGLIDGELLTVSMDFIGDYIAVGADRYNGNQGAVALFRYQDRTGDSEANRTVYFDPSDADYFFYGSESSNTMAGSAVKNVGDLNGDGHDDLMIGSAENDSGAGLVQVVYGPF